MNTMRIWLLKFCECVYGLFLGFAISLTRDHDFKDDSLEVDQDAVEQMRKRRIREYVCGVTYFVSNDDRKTSANKFYYVGIVKPANGNLPDVNEHGYHTYALTQHEMERAIARATKNPEDIPTDIMDLFEEYQF